MGGQQPSTMPLYQRSQVSGALPSEMGRSISLQLESSVLTLVLPRSGNPGLARDSRAGSDEGWQILGSESSGGQV